MTAIKKSISITENLVKEANTINPNFSLVVEAALIEYIHQHKMKKAIQSFGQWEPGNQSSVDIVNDLRRYDNRDFSKNIQKKRVKK